MPLPLAPTTRGPAERAEAWLYTGPLGHLWSAVADLTAYAAGALAQRVRRRPTRR